MKFKYQGTHDLAPNRPSAIFDFNGTVRPRRGDKLNLSGDVHGRVEVAPATGEILLATTDLKVDVDVQSSVGLIRVTGTMHGEVKPPPTAASQIAAPPERKPDKPPVVEPGDTRLEWAIPSDRVPVIREAERQMRDRAPLPDFDLAGPVVRLERADGATTGKVTVVGIVDDRQAKVAIELGDPEYHAAVRAHDHGKTLRIVGTLAKEARGYVLRNPADMVVEEE